MSDDKLPAADLFCSGTIPEPLSEEGRAWLADQLHNWPKRVNEARTCAIGALTDMAVTEFCRLQSERASMEGEIETLHSMREIAQSLGYPSILEALEATPALTSSKTGDER